MSSPAKLLVKVKSLREEAAQAALATAAAAVASATANRDAKQHEIETYRQWRPKREHELYAEISRQPVSLQDLEELNATVAGLRDHERALGEQLADLERLVHEAESKRNEAERARRDAQKEVEKMVELETQLSRRQALEQERKSEQELEEFSRKRDGMLG
jgi:hypothetical protein